MLDFFPPQTPNEQNDMESISEESTLVLPMKSYSTDSLNGSSFVSKKQDFDYSY